VILVLRSHSFKRFCGSNSRRFPLLRPAADLARLLLCPHKSLDHARE
jgi:hypothetical protein